VTEVRSRIGDDNWNKMIKDATFLGAENDQIQNCYKTFYGVFVYLCFPCFWAGLYKYADDKTADIFEKWKRVFDEKKIPFELHYRPGNFRDACFSGNFDAAPRTFCFVIDIENIFIEEVRPRKHETAKIMLKTPENDCSCICFDNSADKSGSEETKEQRKLSKAEEMKNAAAKSLSKNK
jgi:hypothetical protein